MAQAEVHCFYSLLVAEGVEKRLTGLLIYED